MQLKAIFLSLGSLLLLASCAPLYGIHRPDGNRQLSRQELPASLQNCPLSFLDSSFLQRVQTFASGKNLRHDVQQPLQLWLFEDGRLVAGTVNCYASGFPNLKWELRELQKQQVIHTQFEAGRVPEKAVFEQIFQVNIPADGRAAIVGCSHFLGRQNKRFLKEVAALKKEWPGVYLLFAADPIFQ